MKSRSLTTVFTDLIDDYKVSKVDDLIKDIKKYIKTDNKDHERKLANSLDMLNISNAVDKLSLIFTEIEFDQSIQEWKEYQSTKDYKVQTLKTKITTFIKNSKGKLNITDEEISTIKSILNHHKVSFNLESIDSFIDEDDNKQKETWKERLLGINSEFDYANWLDLRSSQACNISFATHIAKLTHSSIKGATNIFFNKDDDSSYFSTVSLKNKIIDVSQSNNALAPIGKMLQLESSDSCLSNKLRQGDLSDLAKFSKNSEQLENWKQGFLKVFELKNPVTHYLSKQIYFPVNIEDEYHIISPMQSSTLDQAIFEKINFVKFSPEMTAIRKSKREETYNPNQQMHYPNIAILKVTQTNHGNGGSPLNGKRGGKRYLFSSSPPVWESSFSPPIKQENLFDGEFNNKARRKAKELQTYLLKLNFALEKQGREFGNKQIRDKVKELINELIEILFDYAAQVQNLEAQTGWSKESKLKEEHQLWLDPYRNDLKFQEKRKSGYWQEEVCKDFALWINKKLEHKKMKLAKFESDKWAKLLKNRLKRFEKGLEVAK